MGKISPHEPKAELLSPEDVDKDVASLSEALMEKRAERIARNVLAHPDVSKILRELVEMGICADEEEAITRALKAFFVAVSPTTEGA
ncbi:MAG: hypothetical protein ACE5MB_00885 [Anaerolineae bacterium]